MQPLRAKTALRAVALISLFMLNSGRARADEVCRPCPFDCAGIGGRDEDCGDRPRRYGQCCVDLDNRGMDQLRRKDQENQYNREHHRCGGGGYNHYNDRRDDPSAYDDRNGYQPGDCPPGFHVNDRNCTREEHLRGCRDLRSPSNKICVGWGGEHREPHHRR